MNLNPYLHIYRVDIRKGMRYDRARAPVGQGDALADRFVVSVFDDGTPVDLTGGKVLATVIRPDGITVPVDGTVEDDAACVTLDDMCYDVSGDIIVTISIELGEMRQTLLQVSLNVATRETTVIAETPIWNLADLGAAVQRAEEAAKRAEEAADSGGGGTGGIVTEKDPTVPDWAKNPSPPTYTAEKVGADPTGTAYNLVSTHNADEDAHPAIRQLISDLSGRLNALADSDDTTLDQLSEIVAYIKSNKSLIDSITTGKVSTADIVNNLTSTATDKPLSAAQGKVLKALIDAIVVPTKTSQLTNDSGYLTEHQDISHLLPRTELGAAVDVALAEAQASGAFDGEDGKTPVKGTDYWTPADQEIIVQQVIAALGTPVFGRVDADNNIILTGNLESATYTVKYEHEDGTLTDIGTISFEAVAYTNLADQTSADWLTDKRINSSGVLKDASGWDMTNYIPVTDTSILHVKGFDVMTAGPDNNNYGRMYFYGADMSYIGYIQPNASGSTTIDNAITTADYDEAVTLFDWGTIKYYYESYRDADIAYIRFGGITTAVEVIITDGENIQ